MRRQASFFATFLLLTPCIAVGSTITVSGHITGPGGSAAEAVIVQVNSTGGESAEATTDSSGYYSVEVTPGAIAMHLRPQKETRLAEHHAWIGEFESSFTWDFQLLAGALVSGSAMMPDGTPLGGRVVDFYPLTFIQPDGEWLSATTGVDDGDFEMVIPLGVHWMGVGAPPSYYPVDQPVDLSAGDVSDVVLTVTNELSSPYPEEPPDRSKITVGTIDALGEAQVVGAVGAVQPYVHVLVVNLDSLHQAHAVSAADGSFATRIFAPPGSAILVKHGAIPMGRWREIPVGVSYQFSPYPGTIIELPHSHQVDGEEVPFSLVGPVDFEVDFLAETLNWVGAAWVMTGSLGPSRVLSAGD